MAGSSSAEMLEHEASCYICHQYYTQPVSVDCGHSFCQVCITQHWEKWGSDFSCPRCGEMSLKRKLRPNKELENVVEIVKRMKREMTESASGEKMCETHQQPMSLFSRGKEALFCSTCAESQDDESEAALLPLEEAVQSYKEELDSLLKAWKEKREEGARIHTEEEERAKEFQKKVNILKQKIVSSFEEAELHLKQNKITWLDQLEELEKTEEMFVTKLSGDICLCDALIQEMEDKCQQPPSTFLQDIGKTLQRCKVWDFQQSSICSELENKVIALSKKHLILKETLQRFKEDISKPLEVKWVKVTLGTAHPQLKEPDDWKTLTRKRTSCDRPGNSKQFRFYGCSLGHEVFTSGRYYWEVKVGPMTPWAVGVAEEFVDKEKYRYHYSPSNDIWALHKDSFDKLKAGNTELICDIPKTIGICLDYEGRQVSFFDADRDNVLHTFRPVAFKKKIYPFFWLGKDGRSDVGWISL